ncbi:MAG: hypothetical protein HC806_03280 [Anaerolineae bacterium]|nr:hypothetical protein [Anaerolineae bacterium]
MKTSPTIQEKSVESYTRLALLFGVIPGLLFGVPAALSILKTGGSQTIAGWVFAGFILVSVGIHGILGAVLDFDRRERDAQINQT